MCKEGGAGKGRVKKAFTPSVKKGACFFEKGRDAF